MTSGAHAAARSEDRLILLPVILDRGDHARVAMVPFHRPLAVGDRFLHQGQVWEVVRAKDHARGAVAVPARPRGGC